MLNNNIVELEKRAKGKLVAIGFGIDRIFGIFSTAEKALGALQEARERNDHNWWMEFRKLDRWERPTIFERVLLRTKPIP